MLKKILISVLVIFVSFVALGIVYEYPLKKYLAVHNIEKYMKLQGTSMENVAYMTDIFKNKSGGYEISVVYKDNPEVRYRYFFNPSIKKWKEMFGADSAYCSVSNNSKDYDNVEKLEIIKYLPLSKDYHLLSENVRKELSKKTEVGV